MGLQVLLVDDSGVMRKMISRSLRHSTTVRYITARWRGARRLRQRSTSSLAVGLVSNVGSATAPIAMPSCAPPG